MGRETPLLTTLLVIRPSRRWKLVARSAAFCTKTTKHHETKQDEEIKKWITERYHCTTTRCFHFTPELEFTAPHVATSH